MSSCETEASYSQLRNARQSKASRMPSRDVKCVLDCSRPSQVGKTIQGGGGTIGDGLCAEREVLEMNTTAWQCAI